MEKMEKMELSKKLEGAGSRIIFGGEYGVTVRKTLVTSR